MAVTRRPRASAEKPFNSSLGFRRSSSAGNAQHGHRPLADEGQDLGSVGAPDMAIGGARQAGDDGEQLAVAIERLAQAIARLQFCRRMSRLLRLERPHRPASDARCAGILDV
jgi:hypothetical protein